MDFFIFTRHGQSQANSQKLIAKDDSPLTELGIQQAREAAQKIRGSGIKIIAASPILRARQTAEVIAKELGFNEGILLMESLRERGLGELEGTPKVEESGYYYKLDNMYGVEPRKDVLQRMYNCLEELNKLGRKGRVLAVGHTVSGYFLIQASKNRTVETLEPPTQLKNAEPMEISFPGSTKSL